MSILIAVGLPLVLAILLLMMGYLCTRRSRNSIYYFLGQCTALLFYTLGYLLETTSDSLKGVILALKVENIGIPAFGVFFLLSTLQIVNSDFLHRWMGFLALGHIFFIILMVYTNELHHQYYSSVDVYFGEWTQSVLGKGPLYYYNQAVSIACSLASYVVLARRYMFWPCRRRKQMMLMVVGSIVTFISNLINLTGILPTGVDIFPFACCITLVCMFITIVQNRLYDLVPMASETAMQTMDNALVVLDQDNCYLYANDAAVKLFPSFAQATIAKPVHQIDGWPKQLSGPLCAGEVDFEMDENEQQRYFKCRISAVEKEDGAPLGWSVLLQDATQITTLMANMEKLAVTDPLTGIFNRRQFYTLAEKEVLRADRHNRPLSLIMFDLDHFKSVNDTYGHRAGDLTLITVTQTIQRALRGNDIFARYGGEEFLLLLPETDGAGAEAFAQRLLELFATIVVDFEGAYIQIRASFGVVEHRKLQDLQATIDAVDKAMFTAKSNGRNCVFYDA